MREQPYVLYQVCSQMVTASIVLFVFLCCDCWVYSQGRAVHGACSACSVSVWALLKKGENIVKGGGALGGRVR